MAGEILVAVKGGDPIEEIVPYLEKITQPGVRVLFLIPYPVESRLYWRDHWVTAESARKVMLVERRVNDRYSWEMQKGLAEEKISPARKALQKRRVDVAVEVYTGSLRKKIREYTASGGASLVLMPGESYHPFMRLLQGMVTLFGLLRRPSIPTVILLNPKDAV